MGNAAATIIRSPTACGWRAGGIRAGQVVRKTDELCFHIAEDPVHVHDLQAVFSTGWVWTTLA